MTTSIKFMKQTRKTRLLRAVQDFSSLYCPLLGTFVDDHGEVQLTNDWQLTKWTIERYLDRKLTREEITILSISKSYGCTPGISENQRSELFKLARESRCESWGDLYDLLKSVL